MTMRVMRDEGGRRENKGTAQESTCRRGIQKEM